MAHQTNVKAGRAGAKANVKAAPARAKRAAKPKAPKVTVREGNLSINGFRLYTKGGKDGKVTQRLDLDVRIMSRAEYEAVSRGWRTDRESWAAVGLDGDRVFLARLKDRWGDCCQDQPEEPERAAACRGFRSRLANFLEQDPAVEFASLDLGRDGGGVFRITTPTDRPGRCEYLLLDLTLDSDA